MSEVLSYSRVCGLRYPSTVDYGAVAYGRRVEDDYAKKLKAGGIKIIRGRQIGGALGCGVAILAKPDVMFGDASIMKLHLIEVKAGPKPLGPHLLQGLFDLRAAEVDRRSRGADVDLRFYYASSDKYCRFDGAAVEDLRSVFDDLCLRAAAMLGWIRAGVGNEEHDGGAGLVFEGWGPPQPKLVDPAPADSFRKLFDCICGSSNRYLG